MYTFFYSINDLTGDIASTSATWLHVWSANGDPLAMVNTSIGSADRMQQILCVTFSTAREWDQQNVVITGLKLMNLLTLLFFMICCSEWYVRL